MRSPGGWTKDLWLRRLTALTNEQHLKPRQAEEEALRVPLEMSPQLKYRRRGLLVMARHDDPNSGRSACSVILNPTPHLDMTYTIFG
ncbi:hypothetical protein WJX74_007915 [Apatococcus lobatus]|uniref:PPIase cyclophilin-type domain-containing protein n=1 Tax=Apatococcus lobatus TaxID=904363 RepID=A0AAW1Q1M0_9CHLO